MMPATSNSRNESNNKIGDSRDISKSRDDCKSCESEREAGTPLTSRMTAAAGNLSEVSTFARNLICDIPISFRLEKNYSNIGST